MWCVNHGVTLSIYYKDPDGNQIETQVDSFETPDAASKYMDLPDFHENPIGVDFDPEDLVRAPENGESVKKILQRPSIGPRGPDSVPTGDEAEQPVVGVRKQITGDVEARA